ncbi:hypothetical protein [cf. Phormidesmis sp. LEGE 11477]|uniref:COG1470 family protein n=1 Tax=cf. Phormidesmis sp. LEGE 11477 TaxID=1828680 RepID=UPI001880023C|nr:hypothetical protein [cf. Phormidesmis sp. LEGE 11477]MBE9060429.1 hypothetical protein [cf. Phormidesmis sp. LEGE 11477]
MTALLPITNPFTVVLTSSGDDVVRPGETFTLGVTIQNDGGSSAIAHARINADSPLLSDWCESMQAQLALESNRSGELSFQFRVPLDAFPQQLKYELIVDSEAYVNASPVRYRQSLHILPAEQSTVEASDPVFYLEPQTTTQRPAIVQPIGGLPVQIWVENRSNRVDRFRLSCLGLPTDWEVSIDYPKDYQGIGLVRDANSLGLNPGAKGQILLMIKPSANAIAQVYIPTIRLRSQNNPTLNLLELLYLQISPTYLLQSTLQILRNRVGNQTALFELQLINSGNTYRELQLEVENLDDSEICQYALEPEYIRVEPFSTRQVLLKAQPQGRWKRPFYGGGRLLNFRVKLRDTDNHPLLTPLLPGNLSWLPRPWWQLLLCVLAALGLIGLSAWLIWWRFFRIPPAPAILEFSVADTEYQQANNDFARVNWQIDNSQRIEQIELTGYSESGEILSGPLTYSFTDETIPAELASFCNQQERLLRCSNVRTDASRPGEYTFELSLKSKDRRQKELITQRTNVVNILPIAPTPFPQVTDFLASENRYLEAAATTDDAVALDLPIVDRNGILLNWRVELANNLQALQLTGRTEEGDSIGNIVYQVEQTEAGPDIPKLSKSCQFGASEIVCENVPTELTAVGSYQFELLAIPIDGDRTDENPSENPASAANQAEQPAPAATETITIQPLTPVIQLFVDSQPAAAKYVIPIDSANLFFPLSWAVDGGSTTQVELLPSPGAVPPSGQLTIPLKPESGSTTITLQAENAAGESVSQSIVVETYDPTQPATPEEIAATAAAAAASATTTAITEANQAEANQNNGSMGSSGQNAGSRRSTGQSDRLSPSGRPPRFN